MKIIAIGGERRIRFAWPDEDSLMGRVLPVVLLSRGVARRVLPGDSVLLPAGPVTAVAVAPGAPPFVAEVKPAEGGYVVMPFSTEEVVAAATTFERQDERFRSVAFGVNAWSSEAVHPSEGSELNVALGGQGLLIAPPDGQLLTSASVRLTVAARATPTRIVAVPALGPGECAVVDLATEREFGSRPALVPGETHSRLLLAYLSAGEYEIARLLALRLVNVLSEARPLVWSEPSLLQLLVGYAFAASEDGPALAAWCRRTRSERLLGVDGRILAAIAASLGHQPRDSARLLLSAEPAGAPVLALGLELAVRLGYRLSAKGYERGALDRLLTAYSVLSTRSDPLADTIITLSSERQPVSLEGRGWLARTKWGLTYPIVRARLPYALRTAAQTVEAVSIPSVLSTIRSSISHPGESMKRTYYTRPMSFAILMIAVVGAWLSIIGVVVWVAISGHGDWERLVAPLSILGAAAFTFLGATISGLRMQGVREQVDTLLMKLEESEQRVRAVEDEAMKGRALAATLQADLSAERSADILRHARLSRSLFGDLVDENAGRGEVGNSSSDVGVRAR